MPNSTRAISVRPLPTSPPKPRISPARSSNETSSKAPSRERPFDLKTTAPGSPSVVRIESVERAADHQSGRRVRAIDRRPARFRQDGRRAARRSGRRRGRSRPCGGRRTSSRRRRSLSSSTTANSRSTSRCDKRRRWLVHDQDARIERQRAGNFDELLLGCAQSCERRGRRRRRGRPVCSSGWPSAHGGHGRNAIRRSAWPMNRFSAMLRSGNRPGCWCITAMPARCASSGERKAISGRRR